MNQEFFRVIFIYNFLVGNSAQKCSMWHYALLVGEKPDPRDSFSRVPSDKLHTDF